MLLFALITANHVHAQNSSKNYDLRSKTSTLKTGKTLLCTDSDGMKFYAVKTKNKVTYQAYDKKGTLLVGSMSKKNTGHGPIKHNELEVVACVFCVKYIEDGVAKTKCKEVSCETRL
jgi:hypothetical protein